MSRVLGANRTPVIHGCSLGNRNEGFPSCAAFQSAGSTRYLEGIFVTPLKVMASKRKNTRTSMEGPIARFFDPRAVTLVMIFSVSDGHTESHYRDVFGKSGQGRDN